ncbi:MAG: hypothetical protein K8S99_10625 [Planctomycetes bacterium]|nr:hypothetical protein [Planctomycetota bacterium]
MRFMTHKQRLISAVFFCSTGLVYAGPVVGADNDNTSPAHPAPDMHAEQPATQPAADAATEKPAADKAGGIFEKPAVTVVKNDKLPDGQSVSVGSFGQIDLHVKELDLTQVLQLLSIQSQRNIVATRNVSGAVSADLYGVDFYEALDAILHPNGFGYKEKGNFIYVYTAAEMKAIQDAERKLVHHVTRLNYISAADASKFLAPLLSPAGSIAVSAETTAGFEASISDGGANTSAHVDTLIIRDYQENLDQIMATVKELDTRPKQVMVEASILKAKLTEDNAWGVDMTILADFAFDGFAGGPLSLIDGLLAGTGPSGNGGGGVSNVGQTGDGGSGLRVGIISDHISAFIKALDSVTDTTVLANPKLLVLNRQKANLLIGEKLGYLSSTANSTSTTQTVEFLEVGTQLSLRPFISDDGYIRMELRPSISDGSTRTVGGSGGSSPVIIPDETTQELTTNVMVRSGQTVVLGGLFKEDTTVSRRQVPYLGDVPVLGAAFKGHDDTVERNEVIFLVTPTIMKDEALYAASDTVKNGVELARVGAREALLPWSRSKLSAAHMRDAIKYYEAGDRDKALWATNMVLTLDPTTVEAMELREKITGEHTYWPDRGIMDTTIENMVKENVKHKKTDAGDAAPAEQAKPAAAQSQNDAAKAQTSQATQTEGQAAKAQAQAVQAQQAQPAQVTAQAEQAAATETKSETTAAAAPAEQPATQPAANAAKPEPAAQQQAQDQTATQTTGDAAQSASNQAGQEQSKAQSEAQNDNASAVVNTEEQQTPGQ